MTSPDQPTPVPYPAEPPAPTPLFQSESFYVTLLTYLLPLGTLIFHKDFSNSVQIAAQIIAGTATLVLLIKKMYENVAHTKALAEYRNNLMHFAHEANTTQLRRNGLTATYGGTTNFGPPISEQIDHAIAEIKEHITKIFAHDASPKPASVKASAPAFRATTPSLTLVVEETVSPPVLDEEAGVSAPVKKGRQGRTTNGLKSDGSLDLRTKEGRALKASQEAGTDASKKVALKKVPVKATVVPPTVKKATRPRPRKSD